MWVKRDEMLIRGINELILLICGDLQATSYTPAGWLKAWDPFIFLFSLESWIVRILPFAILYSARISVEDYL